jgi:NTP pyrophosphatase (non-canonical NTP hydrolase)
VAHESTAAGLGAAAQRARAIRELYHRLELDSLGRTWTVEEDVLGLLGDTGLVCRLVLAAQGTWPRDGDVPAELQHKLAECLWWILVLADRLGVDIDAAFDTLASRLQADLSKAVDGLAAGDPSHGSGDTTPPRLQD